MIRYFNYFLFIVLFLIFIIFDFNSKISTQLQTILPNSKDKELLEVFSKFDSNKKIFLVIKGDSKEALKKLNGIEKEFVKIDGLQKEGQKYSKEFLEYKSRYRLYLNDIDEDKLKNIDIKKELDRLYNSLFDSFLTVDIDKNDPLNIIQKENQTIHIKNGKLMLGDYGYLTVFSIDKKINSLDGFERIYDSIKTIEERYVDIKSFSSIYYFVENSRYIKNDASKIVILATIILLLLYFVVLRNINLLLNTLLTLGSSALLATIILISIYDQLSLFVLVFGLSISTIAIDYMFHHYFHKSYEKKQGFNQEVFFGFLTTFIAFFILSFVDFLLIKQITIFTMISLFCSYIIFAFIYPSITFAQKEFAFHINGFDLFNSKYILLFSLAVFLFALPNLHFDFDIKSLDYDNKALKEKESFFQSKLLKKQQQTVLIKAKIIEELITYNEQIKKIDNDSKSSLDNLISQRKFLQKKQKFLDMNFENFKKQIEQLAPKIGFKKDSFKEAYNYDLEYPKYSYEQLEKYAVEIKKYQDGYISPILISNDRLEKIYSLDFVHPVNLKILFEKSLQNDIDKIIKLGVISLCFIIAIIIFIARSKILYALGFLSFPSAVIFLYLSFIEVNILHIFMLFIILAISIDYAIYSTKNNSLETKKAIVFSALSSFAGFGVLVFSSTVSLFSIGSVATLGIMAVLILIFFSKGQDAVKSL